MKGKSFSDILYDSCLTKKRVFNMVL